MRKKILVCVVIIILVGTIGGIGGYYFLSTPSSPSTSTKMKVAAIFLMPVENPYESCQHRALMTLKEGGLIDYVYTENVAVPDAENVLTGYAESGYEFLVAGSWFPDAVRAVVLNYPDVCVVGSGGGMEIRTIFPLDEFPTAPSNYAWIADGAYMWETTYVSGVLSGLMTESNLIGIVDSFPGGDMNIYTNAFIAGVKSVNPDAHILLNWLESFYDPTRAKESALGMIDSGADIIWCIAMGGEVAAKERGVYAVGYYIDTSSFAPEHVLTSVLWNVEPYFRSLVENVGTSDYAGEYKYGMAENGTCLTPLLDVVPQTVRERIDLVKEDILTGRFTPEWITERPENYWGPDL